MRPAPPAVDLSALARDCLGLRIDPASIEKLSMFANLLSSWAERMNLVSDGSRGDILVRHVLDSCAPVTLLAEARVLVDIGSGAGFPGVPLAILLPRTRFELIESRRKRANFLRHVIRTVGIENARVHELRGEDWRSDPAPDVTIGRAVRFDVLVSISAKLLSRGGRLLAMRKAGQPPPEAVGFEIEQAISYALPRGERHEILSFRKCST